MRCINALFCCCSWSDIDLRSANSSARAAPAMLVIAAAHKRTFFTLVPRLVKNQCRHTSQVTDLRIMPILLLEVIIFMLRGHVKKGLLFKITLTECKNQNLLIKLIAFEK